MNLLASFYKATRSDAALNRILMHAVKDKKPRKVRALILAGANPDQLNESGFPLLAAAASGGDLKTVKALRSGGARLDAADKAKRTALIWSMRGNHTDIAEFLIDEMVAARVGVDQKAENGESIFINAMIARNDRVIDKLIDVKANLDIQDNEGMTPLMWALRIKRYDLAKKILEAGANPDMQDKDGRTALMQAAENGQTDILTLLVEHQARLNIKDHKGRTALMVLAGTEKKVNLDCLDILLTARVTVEEKDAEGRITGFRQERADLDTQDKNGETALMHAVYEGEREVVRRLIHAGASVHLKAKGDVTALMMAARGGDEGIVKDLLAAGADPHDKATSGLTSKMWAAAYNRKAAFDLLDVAEKQTPSAALQAKPGPNKPAP